MTKTETRDPQDLRLHKLSKQIPEPDKDSPAWLAMVESIRSSGILQPLIITDDGFIMDGGWRWRAAKLLQLTEVPVIVRPEKECGVIIADTLIQRKLMTRGAAIYLVLPLLKEFVESAEDRRLANLRRGTKTNEKPLKSPKDSLLSFGSIAELCEAWGVCQSTYRRAAEVRELFDKKPAVKAEWEPKLLAGDKNLWNVLSAVGGAGTDQSGRAAGVEQSQLEFWDSPFDGLKNAVPAWSKLEEAKREAVLADWKKVAKKLPQDLRDGMREVLDELEAVRA